MLQQGQPWDSDLNSHAVCDAIPRRSQRSTTLGIVFIENANSATLSTNALTAVYDGGTTNDAGSKSVVLTQSVK
jgi:hypothetical protein